MSLQKPSKNACDVSLACKPKPNHPPIPNKEIKAVSEHTDVLQTIWEGSMKGVGGLGLPHRNCAVLLISWTKALDDLHTGDEVDRLEAVFKDLFHYTVVKEQVQEGKLSPHLQVQKILLDFVVKYDDEETLLVVYYAGHGAPLKEQGIDELLLAGKRTTKTKANPRNYVVWSEAEMIIKRTQSDVFVIFDCCYAGVLAKQTRSITDRSFEFLAACGSDDVTEMPGDNSFTSALIWALKDLIKSKSSFTTHQLLRKINAEAPNFPRHQHALILERGEYDTSSAQKLVLAPLPKPGEKDERGLPPKHESPKSHIKNYLDLRFFYDKPPAEDEIKRLSKCLKDMIARGTITTRHVGWLRMVDMAENVTDRWKRRTTVTQNQAPLLAQKFAKKLASISQRPRLNDTSPMTPPPSESGLPDSSIESTPESLRTKTSAIGNVEMTSVGNVENMTVSHLDTLTLNTSDISTARLQRIFLGSPDYLHRLKIFVVGLVIFLLEYFHSVSPREAPVMALLSFCGYAWYMTNLYHKTAGEPTMTLTYLPLLIEGVSIFICSKILDHYMMR